MVDLAGSPTLGEICRPWATEIVGTIFGAYETVSGIRHINDFHLTSPRRTSSRRCCRSDAHCAAPQLARSAEFFILAPTKEIADNSFVPTRDMVRADKELQSDPSCAAQLPHHHPPKHGRFLKVAAADSETVGGKKTVGLAVDELWQFGKRANAEAMIREAKGGLASRPEGFVISAATKPNGAPAASMNDSITSATYATARSRIRAASASSMNFRNGSSTAAIIGSANFYIPNPNLGASVGEQYLVAELAKAEHGGASLVNYSAKHLNVQPTMAMRADGWAGARIWSRGVDGTLSLDELLAAAKSSASA